MVDITQMRSVNLIFACPQNEDANLRITHRQSEILRRRGQKAHDSRDSWDFLRWVAGIIHPNAAANCLRPLRAIVYCQKASL